jgi:cell division septation protein DedD
VPYRPDGDFLQDDDESRWSVEPEEPEGGAWWKWAVAVLSLALFGGVVWYAYHSGSAGPVGPVRTVEADLTPYKAKPENPGGEVIPDQDKLVFNEAVGRTTETEDILGDQPEQPQSKPEAVSVRKFVPPKPKPPPEPEPAPIAEAAPPAISLDEQVAAADAAPPAQAKPPAAATPPQPADPKAMAGTAPPKFAPVVVQQPQPAPEAKPAEPPKVVEAAPAGGKSPVVQLGAYGTEAGAMESWAQVQRKQGGIVSGLSPRVIKFNAPGKGELYRLVIGPFADRSAATGVCAQLKANGRDCIVNAN